MVFFRHHAHPGAGAPARAVGTPGGQGQVSDAGCVFCTVIAALERSDTYPSSEAGQMLRKVRDLPASIAILAPDQYYKGYTMVVSKTHATELYDLPHHESTQYFNDMLAVARAIATA